MIGEGQTPLQQADELAPVRRYEARPAFLQYQGLNPSGSFKDNGMTAAFTHARRGRRHAGGLRVDREHLGEPRALLPAPLRDAGGGVHRLGARSRSASSRRRSNTGPARSRSTAISTPAWPACRRRRRLGIYLVNSRHPFRLEGQKTIMFRVLECLGWQTPDWIVVPGGNLGIISAFGKAFID